MIRFRIDPRGLVLPIIILAAWFVVSENGLGNTYVFVTFGRIGETFGRMLNDGTIAASLWGTVWRMGVGFVIGAGFGLLLGLWTGLSQTANNLISPSFHALRQIAIFAWMPLLTAWLGIGGQTVIALVALGAFYPTVINVEAGCRNVPLPYLEVGRVLELNHWQTVRQIVLPAAAPAIFAGLELALATAWLSTIGAEYFISAGQGLGIILSSERMRGSMDGVIVGIVLIGFVGLVINRGLALVARRSFRWRGEEAQ